MVEGRQAAVATCRPSTRQGFSVGDPRCQPPGKISKIDIDKPPVSGKFGGWHVLTHEGRTGWSRAMPR